MIESKLIEHLELAISYLRQMQAQRAAKDKVQIFKYVMLQMECIGKEAYVLMQALYMLKDQEK